jgi:peptidylprolyl isomerase
MLNQPSGGTGHPQWKQAPEMTIDPAKQYTATIQTTEGTLTAQLLPGEAPKTVNNFVFLAREGYYNGVPFHRVIKNFMVQTGDPTGTGSGGPGYRFADEPIRSDYEPGTLAMANSGPHTNGSQFFIVHGSGGRKLDKKYTIFGRLTAGMEVLEKIANTPVRASRSGESSQPVETPRIESVSIEER